MSLPAGGRVDRLPLPQPVPARVLVDARRPRCCNHTSPAPTRAPVRASRSWTRNPPTMWRSRSFVLSGEERPGFACLGEALPQLEAEACFRVAIAQPAFDAQSKPQRFGRGLRIAHQSRQVRFCFGVVLAPIRDISKLE